MSLSQVLDKYQHMARDQHEKGALFEQLMQRYLKTDPLYANELAEVWLWSEFPFRKDFGGKDLGIDLVAKTVNNEYWAIQCKFYDVKSAINMHDISTFLSNSGRIFQDENGNTVHFSLRLWIDTKVGWGANASEAIRNQQPPVRRLGWYDLVTAAVDWDKIAEGKKGHEAQAKGKTLKEHQVKAVDAAHDYFQKESRGKLIMACGTGKTYTALNIVEKETNQNGFALFLVPSIALLSQTLREWMNDTTGVIYPVCICSDASSSKLQKAADLEDTSTVDLPYPATTDVTSAMQQLLLRRHQQEQNGGMIIIFSTYQSIEVVHQVQRRLLNEGALAEFDIIVCDEAHRTTGVSLQGEEKSLFTKVHENAYLPAARRLYMTATPKLYREEAKRKAKQAYAELCSMDDESIYGKEIFHLGFGEAVEKGLLSDYKVLVLTIGEDQIPPALQSAVSNKKTEIDPDDAAKLIGCINALSKRMTMDKDSKQLKEIDPGLMHTALAFCSTIKKSQAITNIFNTYAADYYDTMSEDQRAMVADVEAQHVDGSMNAMTRQEKLQWLQETNVNGQDCHILTNVRCMSEGVDVPALDAIIFLSSRNSQVDVVQSVGRVMRRAPESSGYDKKYGYIIIPVVVPSDVEPEIALAKSKDFGIVWDVLNALRAHDDRFDAHINKIELNGNKSEKILVGGTTNSDGSDHTGDTERVNDGGTGYSGTQTTLYFSELQGAIYAKMVKNVGTRRYWEQWAGDVAEIARRHKDRILNLIAEGGDHAAAFQEFMTGLHKNINPNISKDEAVDMLAQHLITQPVFEALFENYSFVKDNPISQSMNRILELLDEQALDKDRETLTKFYDAVKKGCAGVTTSEGKQKIILELYDKFFKIALPTTTSKLGIVYTPVPVVDFILRSVDGVLQREFRRHLTDENIHILDPFTGTGTFIVRLLQLDLIRPEDLVRKYTQELHANEIVLLAYYIASINIENAFHDREAQSGYTNFDGICLTDTFQLGEKDGSDGWFSEAFPVNSQRVIDQKNAPIRVIVGNPPYSVGQSSANDNAQNEHYPQLERRLAETYVAGTKATNKNALYDSYIKAFRWASDRIAEQQDQGGIVAFISNAVWLDGAAMDGMRACLEKEFSSIYVFNLRGNQRTQGETSRREGGKIFGSGSRTPTAITILVNNPKAKKEKAEIFYHDIGDYLTREEKLATIEGFGTVTNRKMGWKVLKPNTANDWLNQRSEVFSSLIPMGDKDNKKNKHTIFNPAYSRGVATARDPGCYNPSKEALITNVHTTIDYYNENLVKLEQGKISSMDKLTVDASKINWNRSIKNYLKRKEKISFDEDCIYEAMYRPFFRSWMYFNSHLNDMIYQMPKLFPTTAQKNLLICVSGIGGDKGLAAWISDKIIDLNMLHSGTQCFPLYYYEPQTAEEFTDGQNLFATGDQQQYIRHDGITDFALREARELYGRKVTKEDIFYYVYGFLHLPRYREQFAADLKKSLPRILFVDKSSDFFALQDAGRQLADLHLHYEDQPDPDGVIVEGDTGNYIVDKLRFPKKDQRDTILYNNDITIRNIPAAVYDYVVNGRSPVEWIFDRYQVTIDKKSGIRNDPNDWAREHDKPRYILDLLLSVMTVSLKTQEIVSNLPDIKFE